MDERKEFQDKEKESKKLLQGAKRELAKMQSRIDALKHEVKKLEADNFKIKSLLK